MAKTPPARYAATAVPTFEVREFRPGDVAAAAGLLASAQARARDKGPDGLVLGGRFHEAAPCRALLDKLVGSPRTTSVVAVEDGRVCAYLAGERQLFAPEDFASIYAEPRSTSVPLHGHAAAAGVDAMRVYEAMYTSVATAWVEEGFFVHNVAVSELDRDAMEAFAALGFGRKSVCAIRATEPLDVEADGTGPAEGITIEEIRGRDDEALETFHRRLMNFQTGAPMFWPYSGDSDAKVRAVRRDAMLTGQGFAYIARNGSGEPLGSMLFVPAVFLSPLLISDRMVYLWEGFVDEDRRAVGVGSLLLNHAMRALRERGIEWCALHFVSGNPRGGRFWPSRGFVSVEAVMRRHVDERVAWARGIHS